MIRPVEFVCVIKQQIRPGIPFCWTEENIMGQILSWGMTVRTLWRWGSVPLVKAEGSCRNCSVNGLPPEIPA